MKNKGKINYWVDVAIAIGFLLSALSGAVMYFAPSGGYQGGRNSGYGRDVLLLAHDTWKSIHNWSSLVMTLGALAHLVLHWSWITCMTKNILKGFKAKQAVELCAGGAAKSGATRAVEVSAAKSGATPAARIGEVQSVS